MYKNKQRRGYKTLWFVVFLLAMTLFTATTTTIIASTNDGGNMQLPRITVRFTPGIGAFEYGENGIFAGLFGFRINTLPVPTPPPGYTFIGWFVDGQQIFGPVAATRTITILAAYAPIPHPDDMIGFAIVYDPYPGQLPDTVVPIQSFTYGSVITSMPIPTRDGYSFGGWLWNDERVSAPHIVYSDMIMEAIWEEDCGTTTPMHPLLPSIPEYHFVAAFNPFPGAFPRCETGLRFARFGAGVSEMPPTPSLEGFSFGGWQLPNGNVVEDTLTLRNDTPLIAVWNALPGNLNGDLANASQPQEPPRENPQTSYIAISITIFSAIALLAGAALSVIVAARNHAAGTIKYRATIARYVRESRFWGGRRRF